MLDLTSVELQNDKELDKLAIPSITGKMFASQTVLLVEPGLKLYEFGFIPDYWYVITYDDNRIPKVVYFSDGRINNQEVLLYPNRGYKVPARSETCNVFSGHDFGILMGYTVWAVKGYDAYVTGGSPVP